MNAAFCQVKGHGPVVGDCVDNGLHAGVKCRLSGPCVGAHHGNVLGYVFKYGGHEFCVLLIACVVGKSSEAFVIYGFPH